MTVAYERIHGLRDVGQRCDGSFQASKSKTVAAPIGELYRAFSVARTRRRWLPDVELKVRKSTPQKSMRITWEDGTAVDVHFTEKSSRKSQVAIQHTELEVDERLPGSPTFGSGVDDANVVESTGFQLALQDRGVGLRGILHVRGVRCRAS